MAQAGIFFRVLGNLVGERFAAENFTRVDSQGRNVITLRNLQSQCRWGNDLMRLSALVEVPKKLDATDPFCLHIVIKKAEYLTGLQSPCSEVGFSIISLFWAISPRLNLQIQWTPDLDGNDILQRRMVAAGWCPYWTSVYARKFSPFLVYYLSGVSAHRLGNHRSCRRNRPCKVNDVKYETYKTKHAPSCKSYGCVFKGPDLQMLKTIVSKGALPLIRLRRPHKGAPVKLDIVERSPKTPFIAISHVWSGGLGNFKANTLPQCQVELLFDKIEELRWKTYKKRFMQHSRQLAGEISGRIGTGVGAHQLEEHLLGLILAIHQIDNSTESRVEFPKDPSDSYKEPFSIRRLIDLNTPHIHRNTDEMYAGVYIWMDTLCIPSDPRIGTRDVLEGLKRKAIQMMPLIYAMAVHVLVIDQDIQKMSQNETALAKAAQFATSSWMTRSWTFQEGCLARELSFSLADGTANPEIAEKGTQRAKQSKAYSYTWEDSLLDECGSRYRDMKDIGRHSVSPLSPGQDTSSFIQIWNELSTRQTSLPGDLHGLLAVLLRLSAQEIFIDDLGRRRSESDRMLAILRAQPTLPISLLFNANLRKAPMCNGFDWVPTFPAGYLTHCKAKMVWADNGSGLILPSPENKVSYYLLEEKVSLTHPYEFSISFHERSDASKPTKQHTVFIKLLPQQTENLLIQSSRLVLLWDGKSSSGACFTTSSLATDDGPIHLRFLSPLRFHYHQFMDKHSIKTEDVYIAKPFTGKDLMFILECGLCSLSPDYMKVDTNVLLDTSRCAITKYRRLPADKLQKSLVPLIAVFMITYWITFGIFLNWWLLRYPYESELETCPSWILWTLKIIPWSHRLVGPVLRFTENATFLRLSNVILRVKIPVLKAITSYLPELEYRTEHVRQERYAKSLNYAGDEHHSTRLLVEPTYQFTLDWLAVQTFAFSYLFLVYLPDLRATRTPRQLEVHTFTNYAVFGELFGCVFIEFIWRYFQMDLGL